MDGAQERGQWVGRRSGAAGEAQERGRAWPRQNGRQAGPPACAMPGPGAPRPAGPSLLYCRSVCARRDWKQAFEAVIPPRKRKAEEGEEQEEEGQGDEQPPQQRQRKEEGGTAQEGQAAGSNGAAGEKEQQQAEQQQSQAGGEEPAAAAEAQS